MRILDRNRRIAGVEVDILARDGDVQVVCEVKTLRTAALDALDAADSVDHRRLARLSRAAGVLAENGPARVDVIAVALATDGQAACLHYPNITEDA